MLSIILFVLVISAFAVFSCFRFEKTFEETLPISCMGIILILYLFGIINILRVGAIVICALAFFMYGYTIFYIYKNGKLENIKKNIFNLITPGSVVFVALAMLLAYCNKDRLAMTTDEFSHWLDTVVIMSQTDAFGTAPNSTAVFPSYPPAMSLFQYLLEKINMFITGDFSEWKTYFAYQLLSVAIMLPFIKVKGQNLAKKVAGVLTWEIALITPLYFFKDAYASLYIDPFLGVLGGCGFAAIALTKNKDAFYHIYIAMICAVLAIAKDVGVYLGIFISIYYFIDYVSSFKKIDEDVQENGNKKSAKSLIQLLAFGLIPMLSMISTKYLWKLELSLSHTEQKFSAPFKLKETIETLQGNGDEFCTSVLANFKEAITYRFVYYERMGFNYVSIMTLLTVAFVLFSRRLYKNGRISLPTSIATAVIPSITVIFYVLSLFPLYISRFSEYEARNLASMDRYCGIVFFTGLLLAAFLLRDAICDISNKAIMLIIAIALVLSVRHSKWDILESYLSKYTVQQSQEYRNLVNILSDKINRDTDEDASILIVGNDADVMVHPILATISKPRSFTYSDIYIPEAVEDTSIELSVKQFKQILADKYDYVAIYSTTDSIKNTYADVFEDADSINDLSLYKVDINTGNIEFIE